MARGWEVAAGMVAAGYLSLVVDVGPKSSKWNFIGCVAWQYTILARRTIPGRDRSVRARVEPSQITLLGWPRLTTFGNAHDLSAIFIIVSQITRLGTLLSNQRLP